MSLKPQNDFKAFSISNNANVVSQERYEESRSLKNGFPPDNVTTHELNKVLRQSSTISSVVANFIATHSGGDDVLDDGDIAKLTAQLNSALEKKITTEIPSTSLTQKGIVQLTNKTGDSNTLAVTQKLASDINDNANNKLAKDQNGADIPDKNEFVKNLSLMETVQKANYAVPNSRKINGKALSGDVSLSAGDVGACRAYSGSINTGGGTWTTKEFIVWLKQNGAFDVPYWVCKGSWSYASNRIINDTGCGNICLAGAVVEVMGVESAMTIRVTTPTTTSGNGIASVQFTYINHGKDYRPGWRRDYNAKPDANGNLRVSSPVVDIHPDGTYELTSEAEGVTVMRIETGKYRISGCNGFAKDGAWGIHGGTIVPANSNGLNLIWVNEYVDTSSGDITIECYHRQNTDAPKFAQNKRVKSITATGEVVYYNEGELCDIPDGRVLNVRVQLPASDDDPASPSA
ncbi:phage tail protein [Photorhabdus akhurstii]|uniref:phage tail protein n=1 Tax=Photorhabdus akhurstii TaxID=171438 RepID=UPI000D48866E|nr:phage tail protein [Photorhabdus luminescens]